jgi:hypothetical protein
MLRAGLMAMLESGELPESIIDECDLDIILEKRMRRKNRKNGQGIASPIPPVGYHAPLPIPTPWPQTPHPMPPSSVYAPIQEHGHQMPETAVYAPSAQHRPTASPTTTASSTEARPVADAKQTDQATNNSADENDTKASPNGNSKINRLKNLM